MNHSILSRVDTQPPPEKVPIWVVVLSFTVLFVFFVLLGIGIYKVKEQQVKVGNKAPDVNLISFDGETFSNENLAGKIVVLHFWASWCQPCEEETVLMENAWRQVDDRDDIIFIGVSQADNEIETLNFLQAYKVTYPNGADTGSEIANDFQIRGIPETVIIGRDGIIAFIQIGPFLSTEAIVDMINYIY
jgi:cytochrome c biogenesis protein CcmG/thiol:disulfide interchange protein DsbE